jgi:hypothetical protein
VTQAHLSDQDARNAQLELKAGIVVGFSGTIIGLATLSVGLWNVWSIFVASVMSLAFLWATGLAIAVLWVHRWDRRPHLGELANYITNSNVTDETLAQWVGDAYSSAVDVNEGVLKTKAEMLIASFVGLGVEGALVGVLLITTQL